MYLVCICLKQRLEEIIMQTVLLLPSLCYSLWPYLLFHIYGIVERVGTNGDIAIRKNNEICGFNNLCHPLSDTDLCNYCHEFETFKLSLLSDDVAFANSNRFCIISRSICEFGAKLFK